MIQYKENYLFDEWLQIKNIIVLGRWLWKIANTFLKKLMKCQAQA